MLEHFFVAVRWHQREPASLATDPDRGSGIANGESITLGSNWIVIVTTMADWGLSDDLSKD
jgi:hypothetical protein